MKGECADRAAALFDLAFHLYMIAFAQVREDVRPQCGIARGAQHPRHAR